MHKTAIKTLPTEIRDEEGYIKVSFVDTDIKFGVNAQPYSSKMAQEEYGLQVDSIRYICFSDEPIAMEEGEYVRLKEVYQVVLAHEWECHTEFILKDTEGLEADG